MDLRQFNKYQTPLTEELIKSLPTEVSDELFELINTVPYIERLIKPDRKYAKDLERDDKGRIIVDLLNPHILENMDYFRPSALHFKEHGCYTCPFQGYHCAIDYSRYASYKVMQFNPCKLEIIKEL